MKRISKGLLTALLTCVLFALLCGSGYAADERSFVLTVDPSAEIDYENSDSINWWKNTNDGKYYLFLPSECDLAQLKVSYTGSQPATVNGTAIPNGEVTDLFADGGEYQIAVGQDSYTVVFLTSSGVASIYIDTESGSLDAVQADKEHKEPGTALILDKDGKLQYDGDLDYIKGRGNSTWKADKKPYNIKLSGKANLFGMGKSKKWCLLANRSDLSAIRNQLSYELAQNLDIPYTSDTVQFNLYANGEYQGLYLLTEKVEIDDNRIEIYDLEKETEDANEKDLDAYKTGGAQGSQIWNTIKYTNIPNNPENITGGYLLELEKLYRYPAEASGFVTDRGQAVVVKEPEYASRAQVEYISGYYQDFEDALYAPDGINSKGLHYSEYIDMQSLARMYIIYEFTLNFDGCSSSFYLSKDIDGKLVCGPLWDFDLAFGCMAPNHLINHVEVVGDPTNLYAKTCFIGNHNERRYSLLAQAYRHNDFQELVSEIWEKDFAGTCIEPLKEHVETYSQQIHTAAVMDSVRWNSFQTSDLTAIPGHYDWQVAQVRNFINDRYTFLSNALAKDTYYVKYDIGAFGTELVNDNLQYQEGDMTTVLPIKTDPASSHVRFIGWNTMPDGSGETYQPGDILTVHGNTVLYAQFQMDNTILTTLDKINAVVAQMMRLLSVLIQMINVLGAIA